MTCSPQQQTIVVAHLTVTEVKLVFSHIACSPEAIWEKMHNKKAPHTRCFFVQQFNCQPQFQYGNPLDFLFYGLKTYSFQRMSPREAVSSQAVPGKYFRPHLVNRRRFQPACCFTAGKSDARRNLLQPVTEFTSVQRMQTKLTPISSNGCV